MFLLGTLTSNLLGRWNRSVDALQAVIAKQRNFIATLTSSCSAQLSLKLAEMDTKIERNTFRQNVIAHCELVRRYSALAYGIMSESTRRTRQNDQCYQVDLQKIRAHGLVTKEEEEQLRNMPSPGRVYGWALCVVEQMEDHEMLLQHHSLLSELNALKSAAHDVQRVNEVQLPFPLVQLVCMTVELFLLYICIVSAGLISAGLRDDNFGMVLMAVLIQTFFCIVVTSILSLYSMLSDPFTGDDACDFPSDYYLDLLSKESETQVEEMLTRGSGLNTLDIATSNSIFPRETKF
jgi:hypothetical protein